MLYFNTNVGATTDKDYGPLDPVVNRKERTIHLDWITEHWDRIGQFFAAFASGQTTASVALKRLVGHGPKNRFYRATRERGRVFKTEFILDYLSQPARFARGSDAGSSRENSYTWARRGEAGLVQQSRTSFVRYHLAPLTFKNSLDESNRKSFALVGCGLKRRRKNLHVHVQQDAETIVGTIDQRKAPIRRDQSFQLSFRRQTLMATHFAWGEGCHGSLHGIEGSDGPRTNTPFPSE